MPTIRDKWSFLFHNVLQSEDRVDSDVAEQAFVLVNWMFEKYEKFHNEQGYVLSEKCREQKKAVCSALEAKCAGEPYIGDWPVEIISQWEVEKPFHESLGAQYLNSDWEPFWRMARRLHFGWRDEEDDA